ncbi:MAG: RdgB/HAM1 family non-canonical purine NTP pyrophosphatase [Oscillospiraceae bacterium]
MKLVAATGNKGKLKEFSEILSEYGYEIVSAREAGITEEPEETGTTFEENARIKARAIYGALKTATVADDSGLEVDYLGKAPGVYSARYAPEGERCNRILSELEGVPEAERTARFVSVICFIDSDGNEITVRGECEGKIAFEKRGTNGFGYDPIFLVGGKTMGEMNSEEKNAVSHRGKALRILSEKLKEEKNDK